MSYQNVEKLRQMISGDEKLIKRLDERDMDKFNQALIGIGKEKGIPITLADVQEYMGHAPALTEEQLTAVAGGALTRPIYKSDGTSYSYGSDWRCVICGSTSGTFGTGL